jgi:hypothetical protein
MGVFCSKNEGTRLFESIIDDYCNLIIKHGTNYQYDKSILEKIYLYCKHDTSSRYSFILGWISEIRGEYSDAVYYYESSIDDSYCVIRLLYLYDAKGIRVYCPDVLKERVEKSDILKELGGSWINDIKMILGDDYSINHEPRKHIINIEEDECSICLDKICEKDIIILECFHHFHKDCIEECISDTCPLCRNVYMKGLIY